MENLAVMQLERLVLLIFNEDRFFKIATKVSSKVVVTKNTYIKPEC
jgi:hypothetical protein